MISYDNRLTSKKTPKRKQKQKTFCDAEKKYFSHSALKLSILHFGINVFWK